MCCGWAIPEMICRDPYCRCQIFLPPFSMSPESMKTERLRGWNMYIIQLMRFKHRQSPLEFASAHLVPLYSQGMHRTAQVTTDSCIKMPVSKRQRNWYMIIHSSKYWRFWTHRAWRKNSLPSIRGGRATMLKKQMKRDQLSTWNLQLTMVPLY